MRHNCIKHVNRRNLATTIRVIDDFQMTSYTRTFNLDYHDHPGLSTINKTYLSNNFLIRLVYKRFFHELLTLLADQTFDNLLDVGCEFGVVSNLISKNFPRIRIVGLDMNGEALTAGSQMYSGLSFIKSDACLLPFRRDEFDVVICIEVLEHLKDPLKALNELYRVARKVIIFSVPNSKIFHLLNTLRLKSRTPDHLQNFNTKSLSCLVDTLTRTRHMKIVNPWIITSIDVECTR